MRASSRQSAVLLECVAVIISLALLAAPFAAEAQQTKRIAFLCPTSCSDLPNAVSPVDQAFLRGLAGSVDARNISFDMRGVGIGDVRLS